MCLAWLQALGPAKAIARPTFLAWLKISKAQARPPGPGLCIKCINLDSNFVSPIIIQLAQWPESRTVPVSHKNKLYSSPTLVLSLLHVYHATIITLPLNPWHKTVASKFKFFLSSQSHQQNVISIENCLKLYQISSKKFCTVYNMYTIVLQC